MTISRQFYATATRLPNKVAVIQGEKQLTYAGLLSLVQQQVNILRLNGVERGDHIMVQLKGIDFVVMMLACADAGVCMVPMNSDATRETIAKAYAACDCKHLITEGFAHTEARHAHKLKFQGQPMDNFLIITTSGSTGEPKPILLKQKTKLARVEMMNDLYHCTEDDVTLISTPLHHSMGQRLVLMSVLKGGTLVLMDGWSAEKWYKLVEDHSVTFAVPVASQLKQLAAMPISAPTLRCIVSSSAPLEPYVMKSMECSVYNCYGTTEVSIVTSTDSMTPLGSVGKPIEGVMIDISCGGDITVETPLMFDGYYNLPELTAHACLHDTFETGDLGRMDGEGNLYYLGRVKELINVGGTKVYPADVEAVVSDLPGVAECAAFPTYDDELGEVVAIAVVATGKYEYPMEEGQSLLTLKNVQAHCLARLTDAQLPRRMIQVPELPKTESGKTQRGKLAEIFGGAK